MTELDGIESLHGVVVLAATNRADMIDTALLRPGRFDKIILVPLPDKEGRKKILEINTKEIPVIRESMTDGMKNPDYVDIDKIAEVTDGMSGADVDCNSKHCSLPCHT